MSSPNPPSPARPAIWNREPLPHVGRIIAVGSGKGGVGKSTVTVQLAHALTALGTRVGILDADIYGPSIPRMLGLETRLRPELVDGQMLPPVAYGIKAMSIALIMGDQAAVLRAPMVTKTLTQMLRLTRWGDASQPLDILLVDLPPGTGDVHLSLAQSVPITGAILVITPQTVATMDAQKAAEMFQKINVPMLGVIENMSYFTDAAGNTQRLFGEGGGHALATRYAIPLLGQLPLDPALGAALDVGQSPQQTMPQAPVLAAFAELAAMLSVER